jgi:quercetin dioxygenase-like cupin family protein
VLDSWYFLPCGTDWHICLVALLADEDEEAVLEEVKLTFHAQANFGVRIPPHGFANMQLTVSLSQGGTTPPHRSSGSHEIPPQVRRRPTPRL